MRVLDLSYITLYITLHYSQGRINHSGTPYQRKAGALFSYAKPGFSLSVAVHFFSPKKLTTFFSRYV